jgi:hypothetical protein
MESRARLEQLFRHLDRWRHLPNYQLERRADVLFSLYLPELVGQKVGRVICPTIVPELPILCSLVWPEREGMKSVKADYLLVAQDRSEAYMIELKTDAGSRREVQDDYLEKAGTCTLAGLLDGVIRIAIASQSGAKYASLLRLLASDDLRLVSVPATPMTSKNWFEGVSVLECPPTLKTIYLLPKAGEMTSDVIDFETIARHVSQFDDDLSSLFAEHLACWSQPPGVERDRAS